MIVVIDDPFYYIFALDAQNMLCIQYTNQHTHI